MFTARYGLRNYFFTRGQIPKTLRYFTCCVPHWWLDVGMHPEGPATGHLDTGWFSRFSLSSSKG